MGDIGGIAVNGSSVRFPSITGGKPAPDSNLGSVQPSMQQPRLLKAASAQDLFTPPLNALTVETSSEKSLLKLPSHQVKPQGAKPIGMRRAKMWTLEVEKSYRYQLAGYKDESEYLLTCPEPEYWPNSGMIKCLTVKTTGYFMYFRQTRECLDKHLNKVKIYEF